MAIAAEKSRAARNNQACRAKLMYLIILAYREMSRAASLLPLWRLSRIMPSLAGLALAAIGCLYMYARNLDNAAAGASCEKAAVLRIAPA